MTDPDQTTALGGGVIETFLGERFDIFDPDPRKIHHKDIAHALSMLCRYGGHSSHFYSVAEHSVLMAQYFFNKDRQDLARVALLHDATEAYMGDLVRPIKLMMPAYQSAEGYLQRAIFVKYGLDPTMPLEIKQADLAICNDERHVLMSGQSWGEVMDDLPPLGVDIQMWSPKQAEQEWLDLFFTYSLWSDQTGVLG